MSRRRAVDQVLAAAVWQELCEGRDIVEAYILGDESRETIYGITDLNGRKRIVVNPAHDVVDTVVHELVHRLHPRWGERRVIKEASAIVATMSDQEVRKWFKQYQRVKRVQAKSVDPD